MITTYPQSSQRAWAKALSKPAKEFDLTPLPILSGKIPEGLWGTLYRNGPGRLERGARRVGHWFDGDGAGAILIWRCIVALQRLAGSGLGLLLALTIKRGR